jgi:hypothetical protein
MGQAKRRGTFEQRKAAAIERLKRTRLIDKPFVYANPHRALLASFAISQGMDPSKGRFL